MNQQNSFLSAVSNADCWQTFLSHKIEYQHLNSAEESALRSYIEERRYLSVLPRIKNGCFPSEYPVKRIINKEGTSKKRIVYSFSGDTNILLKFLAFYLYRYDGFFFDNCYAFRRDYGVGQAIRKIKGDPSFCKRYCYKTDIRDYFNSIDATLLLEQMSCIRQEDEILYSVLYRILSEPHVHSGNRIIEDDHGAMAGIPVAPFFANWYLRDMDACFLSAGIDYFRYSDDILIFADSFEELDLHRKYLNRFLRDHHLDINHSKEYISLPGESWEFLGFSYHNGDIDLSENTKKKIKAKIRRKSEALRRWQRKKGLPPDKAAIGFIRAMNYKFYGKDDGDDFCWKRWFFPHLTTDAGLKEIDSYMQEYIRYTVTGRHYKGNYRISYQQMKEWGYRCLVHEYYDKCRGNDS